MRTLTRTWNSFGSRSIVSLVTGRPRWTQSTLKILKYDCVFAMLTKWKFSKIKKIYQTTMISLLLILGNWDEMGRVSKWNITWRSGRSHFARRARRTVGSCTAAFSFRSLHSFAAWTTRCPYRYSHLYSHFQAVQYLNTRIFKFPKSWISNLVVQRVQVGNGSTARQLQLEPKIQKCCTLSYRYRDNF